MKNETYDEVMDESIQIEAETILNRELTANELDEVKQSVGENLFMLIQDKIHEVIDFKALVKRSDGAEKIFPHYKVIWKNENAYVKDFKIFFFAKSFEDAKAAIKHQNFITEFDQYQIFKVDENSEVLIETVGEGRGI